MEIKRGNIVLADLYPVKGHEQGKKRPFLIIQNDMGNKYSEMTIGIPLTSKQLAKKVPTNVLILKESSNLQQDSIVLCNQIRSIDKKRILHKISSIDSYTQSKVDKALKLSLGL